MALTQQQSTDLILSEKATHTELVPINSPSATGIWKLMGDTFAYAAYMISVLLDKVKGETEDLANSRYAGTASWIRDQVLKYETGQTVSVVDFVPKYLTPVPANRLITRCSVTEEGQKSILIKVAKAEPPVAITNAEKSGLESYVKKFRFGGVKINISSRNADRVYFAAQIKFQGEYAGLINDLVIAAIRQYYKEVSSPENFNGLLDLMALIDRIQKVQGILVIKVLEFAQRPNDVGFASRVPIYKLSTGTDNGPTITVAGYVVEEDTAGQALINSIEFTPV